MPTGFTYDTYVAAVKTQIPTIVSDPNFQTMIPVAIDYGELMIYRDLDFLVMHGDVTLPNTSIGGTRVTVPNSVIVLEDVFCGAFLTPMVPVSQQYLRMVYAGAPQGAPVDFAVIGSLNTTITPAQYLLDGFGNPVLDGFGNPIVTSVASTETTPPGWQVLFGPASDQVYSLTGYGTQREPALSVAYPQTFISTYLPDLFWAATMIFWSGYNRNFGAQSDQSSQAVAWLQEYQRLLKGADTEEMRKRFASNGWQAQVPTPLAAPRT